MPGDGHRNRSMYHMLTRQNLLWLAEARNINFNMIYQNGMHFTKILIK